MGPKSGGSPARGEAGLDERLRPLVLGAEQPPSKGRFVPLACPAPKGSDLRLLPAVRDTRWRRLSDGAERAAARVIERAERQAQETRDAARRGAEAIMREAERRLQEAIGRETRAFQAQAARLLEAVEVQKRALLERLEYEVAALAADMASAIIRRKIQADDTIVVDVVREALSYVADASVVTITVAPPDEPTVRSHLGELTRALRSAGKISVVAADDMLRGGCVVHAEDATVDARIEAQLERTRARLRAALESDSSGQVTGDRE
jgi:flagellar biosynthesis/type III secretory pathway protein FliH